jgi:hypothetical protein
VDYLQVGGRWRVRFFQTNSDTLATALLGILPYAGLNFAIYETLKLQLREMHSSSVLIFAKNCAKQIGGCVGRIISVDDNEAGMRWCCGTHRTGMRGCVRARLCVCVCDHLCACCRRRLTRFTSLNDAYKCRTNQYATLICACHNAA